MRSASVAIAAALVAALEVACGGKPPLPAPPETARTLVVLLPDPDTGVTRPRIPVQQVRVYRLERRP